MLTHAQVWAGIDGLARRYELTPSGLARIAGLDATTFNPSKRFAGGPDRPRWPSTESISKVLEATGASFPEFAALSVGRVDAGRSAPLIGFAQAGNNGYFDAAGFPLSTGWDELALPGAAPDGVYALEIAGSSMEPIYRDGDRIIVAPSQPVRSGDRVIVKTASGEVMAKELGGVTAQSIDLVSFNPDLPKRTIETTDIAWIARILWASQ